MLNFAKSRRAALSWVFVVSAVVHLTLMFMPMPLPPPLRIPAIVTSWPWSWLIVTAGEGALWALSFSAATAVLKVIFAAGFALNVTLLVLFAWYWASIRTRRAVAL
jgi:hypothetical protein